MGAKTIGIKDHSHTEEVELYWMSLWEKKVQCNEKAEQTKRGEKKRI
jgi:hypothetical protein